MGCAKNREPTWLQKLSFIKNYALDSCETPWLLYLSTGGRALTNLFLTATYMDMGDLVRSFFRPKMGRSPLHSNLRFKRNKARIAQEVLHEPSDLVADSWRLSTGLQRPIYSNGFDFLWQIDTELQKHLGRIVIVNMATDFAFDWFSGILEMPESKCGIGRFRYLHVPGLHHGHGYETVPIATRLYTEGEVFPSTRGVHITEGTWLLRIRGTCGGVAGAGHKGKILWRLWLGQFADKECHPAEMVDSLPTGSGTKFEFLRVVTADDWLQMKLAVIPDEFGETVDAGGLDVAGFRLS